LVEDLAEFLDLLCLERPIVLGVSFGAVLGLKFAARYPWRLSPHMSSRYDPSD